MIQKLLDSYLEDNRRAEGQKFKDRKYYISQMGRCQRMRWIHRKGVESEFDIKALRVFKVGDMFHDFMYKVLEDRQVLLEAEGYVMNDHFVGRYDALVSFKGEPILIDFKTISSYKWRFLLKGEEDEHYIRQLLTYTMLINEEGKYKLTKAGIAYINKEKLEMIMKYYPLTNWRKKQIQEEIDKMTKFWVQDKIPPCSCLSWEKNYSSYPLFCEMTDKEIRSILQLMKKDKVLTSYEDKITLTDSKTKKVDIIVEKGSKK